MTDNFEALPNRSCWVMTNGKAGMRSQAVGLAERVGLPFIEKTVSMRTPWCWFPVQLARLARWGLADGGETIRPPWPDLLITCGGRCVAPSIGIKKASGGRTFTVHIQDPCIAPEHFDMVIPPDHDRLDGKNVYPSLGALHKISPDKLASAKAAFAPMFADQPRPLVAVLIGGNSKVHRLTAEIAAALAATLRKLADSGFGMIVTFSPRTGAENEALIRRQLEGTQVFIWDGRGENPYVGMLALADYLLVTNDSISMISEAAATGKPVMTIELVGSSKKFDAFYAKMREQDLIRSFQGELQQWNYQPLDETGRIATIVREQLRNHLEKPGTL